jgi:hypothetical protein
MIHLRPKSIRAMGGRETSRSSMKKLTSWCVQLTACFLLLATAAVHAQDAKKVDPTGTWTWSTPGRNGGEARESTLKLKLEGDKLTGTMSGRQGNETKIENAKLNGDEISFDVTREFQGNSMTAKYKGKVAGDTITGKISTERDGQTRERDWTAKKKTEEKKEAK